jgi:hypothetical protein
VGLHQQVAGQLDVVGGAGGDPLRL